MSQRLDVSYARHTAAERIAKAYGCELVSCEREAAMDALRVVLRCRTPQRDHYGSIYLDEHAMRYSREDILVAEVEALAKHVRSDASLPDDVPDVTVGSACPWCGVPITHVDLEAWNCGCASAKHDLPEFVAVYSPRDGVHRILQAPDAP